MNAVRHSSRTLTIAALNDRVRQTWGLYPNTQVLITVGISRLPLIEQLEISGKVQAFDSFTEENDPHGEHDFGAFDHAGYRVLWKIDYYDPDLLHASDDPTDTSKTVRVLTIMLADEY